jgi:hypothetical protein
VSFPEPIFRRRRRNETPNIKAKDMIAKLLLKYVSPFLKSWKTSLAGVGTIASGIVLLSGVGVAAADGELSTDQAVIGWGLVVSGVAQIMGKDANVTTK